jgi:Spy/CpxP family protein refolding chaperone
MRLGRLLLAVGVVALLTTPALAQRGRGGAGRGGNSIGQLAQNKSVQEELKVNEDQAKKVKEALDKVREDLKDDYAKIGRGGRRGGGGGGNNASPEERTAARKKTGEAEEKAVKGVLDEKQMKRLQQIHVQQEGIAAFQDDEGVVKALKLNDEQKDKIKAISADLQKEMGNLFGGGGGGRGRGNPETQQKIQSLRKEAMTNATKVLNDDQKKTLKDLTGEPFEVKPDQGGKPRTDF